MSITGERGFNQATRAVSLLDAPVISQSDLVNTNHWINNTNISGKSAGSIVYIKLDDSKLTTAIAQGSDPEDAWVIGEGSIGIATRKKLEVIYNMSSATPLPSTLKELIEAGTLSSGTLNEMYNSTSGKLNIYNEDSDIHIKLVVVFAQPITSSSSVTVQYLRGEGVDYTASEVSEDTLAFTSIMYLSADKDGQAVNNGIDISFILNPATPVPNVVAFKLVIDQGKVSGPLSIV